jgi:isoleucyl-tRNA synthetase
VTVNLADGPMELGPDEVELRVKAQAGFAVSRDGAEVVALDLTLDTDLWSRGLAREVVRQVQDLRKASGLDVSDWIRLHLVGLDFLSPTLLELIGREVLATSVETTAPADPSAGQGTALELESEEGSPLTARAWVIKA